jgi:hypothetical protein
MVVMFVEASAARIHGIGRVLHNSLVVLHALYLVLKHELGF